MFNYLVNGHTALIEKFENSFNAVAQCVYQKTSPDCLPELNTHCNHLQQLAEEHPNHPAIAALFREHIPYLVCASDFLTAQAARATCACAVVTGKQEQLLRLYDGWTTGWLKAYIPADGKVPEACMNRERPMLRAAYETINSSFINLAFKLPAAMALEVVLVLTEAPAGQQITYSQWQYAQLLLTHLQQVLNNPTIPVTEESVINTLLALRCNTGQFSIWYTQHLKDAIEQAGSMAEKKSD